MSETKKIFFIFLPILILTFLLFFLNFKQNKNLFSNETQEKNNEIFQISINNSDPIIGNKKAPITVIAFADFACSQCKTDFFILEKLLTNYSDKFKIVWKGLPINFYPYNSSIAIKYAYCANKQNKFEDFEQYAYSNNTDLSSSTLNNISQELKLDLKKITNCLEEQTTENYIELNKSYANNLNIQKIPTYFLNNKQINPKNEEEWKLILNL